MEHERAVLGVDGNAAFALLGDNLQEGEAEFVEINYDESRSYVCELRAAKQALFNLRRRLNKPNLDYYFGPSHPYGRD